MRCTARAPGFDVIVIDDGSTDDTAAARPRGRRAGDPLPFNLGIGGAVQTGFIYAREHGYEYMAQVDGDGQHEPASSSKLVARWTSDPASTWCAARAS